MRMTEGFPVFPLTFDEEGALQSQDELDALIERAKATPPATDVIFLAHGFRNDVGDATTLYDDVPEDIQIALHASGVRWPCGAALRRRRRVLAVQALQGNLHRRARADCRTSHA